MCEASTSSSIQKAIEQLLTPEQRELLNSLGVEPSRVDVGKLMRLLGIDLSRIDLRQLKAQVPAVPRVRSIASRQRSCIGSKKNFWLATIASSGKC
jgi:hypothetical protein